MPGEQPGPGPTAEKCHDPYLRCALHGAAQVALGIRGCCVISHAPQGCNMLVNAAFSWQDADYTETYSLCTKLCENERFQSHRRPSRPSRARL